MTQFINHRSIYSSLFFVLIIALIIVSRPRVFFDKDGRPRTFGLGGNNTVFSFGVLVVAMAIIAYYIFAVVDIIFAV